MSERDLDQELLRGLDDRAAAAATDLRARAVARPAPAFDPERPVALPTPLPAARAGLGSRRLLAAAAVLALVAGAVGWWASGRDDRDSSPATTTTNAGLLPYVATDLPAGVALGGAYHFDDSEGGAGSGPGTGLPMAFYGPSDGDPEVGVVPAGELGQGADELGEPIALPDGRTARTLKVSYLSARSLLVTGRGDPVALTTRTRSQDQLLALAAGAAVRGGRATISSAALPDGWRLLVTEPDLVGAISPLGATRVNDQARQYGVFYADADGPDGAMVRTISVTAIPGDEARLAVAKLLFADVRAVEVDGRDGLVGTLPGGGGTDGGDLRVVTWAPTPGTIIRLTATAVSDQELLRAARSVVPATKADFAELERKTSLGELEPGQSSGGDRPEIGRGTFADGSEWVLRVSGKEGDVATSAELSVSLADGSGPASSGGSSSSGGDASGPFDAEALRSVEVVERGSRHFGSGLVRDAVAEVELRRADGSVIGSAQLVEGAGSKAWVAELTEVPTVVVALDATGKELGSQRIAENGDGDYEVESQGREVPAGN